MSDLSLHVIHSQQVQVWSSPAGVFLQAKVNHFIKLRPVVSQKRCGKAYLSDLLYHRKDVGKRIYQTCCITEKMWKSVSIRPVVSQKRRGKAHLSDRLYHRKDVGKRI